MSPSTTSFGTNNGGTSRQEQQRTTSDAADEEIVLDGNYQAQTNAVGSNERPYSSLVAVNGNMGLSSPGSQQRDHASQASSMYMNHGTDDRRK
ncbi:hypothetical protein MMC25_002609 [Agyrium rufum]|nr:hypothetical protein [Agyrium rufum]